MVSWPQSTLDPRFSFQSYRVGIVCVVLYLIWFKGRFSSVPNSEVDEIIEIEHHTRGTQQAKDTAIIMSEFNHRQRRVHGNHPLGDP